MTTPVGQISLSDVNAELDLSPTALITMNDAAVRTLAGVGGSGTVISMNDLRGKSNRVAISLTIASNTTNYDVYSNRGPSYDPGKSDITVTINPGVVVYSTSTGSSAFSIPSAFNPADTVTVVNNGYIGGKGGSGGQGGGTYPSQPGTPGNPGGPGLYVQFPVTIQNYGTVGGGGGGGGGARSVDYNISPDAVGWKGGGGGGGGAANGAGGAGGNANPTSGYGVAGSTGPLTAGGAGGAGGLGNFPGGPGGGYGSSGTTAPGPAAGTGGATGAAVTGNPYITWNPTGTRSGPIS